MMSRLIYITDIIVRVNIVLSLLRVNNFKLNVIMADGPSLSWRFSRGIPAMILGPLPRSCLLSVSRHVLSIFEHPLSDLLCRRKGGPGTALDWGGGIIKVVFFELLLHSCCIVLLNSFSFDILLIDNHLLLLFF